MARQMVCEYGMSDALGPVAYGKKSDPVFLARELHEERNYSEDIAHKIDDEVRDLIEGAIARAKSLLGSHRKQLDDLVTVLLEKESLDREEVEAVLEFGCLPAEVASDGVGSCETDAPPDGEDGPSLDGDASPGILPPPIPEPTA